jgi:hypothetical protein
MKYSFASAAIRGIALVFLGFFTLMAAPATAAELRLVMFEKPGCIWCARWNEEIGPIYPKTPQAAAAPLTRLQLGAHLPDEVRLARPASFTPTFVLLSEGDEVGRIEGYPGEDFFWPMLDQLLARSETPPVN